MFVPAKLKYFEVSSPTGWQEFFPAAYRILKLLNQVNRVT